MFIISEFGIAYLSAAVFERTVIFDANHPFAFFLKEGNVLLFEGVYQ